MQDLTEFEIKVLRLIGRDRLPIGNRLIKYVACARRLEKKGYASKGRNWYLTDKGEKALLDRDAEQRNGAVLPQQDGLVNKKAVTTCLICGAARDMHDGYIAACQTCGDVERKVVISETVYI